jgi:hypothetical protein
VVTPDRTIDRRRLAAVPAPALAPDPAVARGIASSVAYLGSDAAIRSVETDIYWPKWDSPWWHMLLLHELGEARQIPSRVVAAMALGLDRLPLHVFPIHPDDAPPGTDLARDSTCHCALGCMVSVLAACGVDVPRALPWVEPWLVRYQMADGGLSCDGDAYLQAGQCPSSMVGTVAPLEAMLTTGAAPGVADRAAGFLIDRQLQRGSSSVHNAAERDAARSWRELCFPRLYFYDHLRGLAALVRWAEAGHTLPVPAIEGVVHDLLERFPDGVVRIGRRSFDGKTTVVPTAGAPRQPASTFGLLEAVSAVGAASPALTRQWTAVRGALVRLLDAGRLTA